MITRGLRPWGRDAVLLPHVVLHAERRVAIIIKEKGSNECRFLTTDTPCRSSRVQAQAVSLNPTKI